VCTFLRLLSRPRFRSSLARDFNDLAITNPRVEIMREFPSIFFFSPFLFSSSDSHDLVHSSAVDTYRLYTWFSYLSSILLRFFSPSLFSVSQIRPIAKRSGNLNFQHFAELRFKHRIPRTKSDVLCNWGAENDIQTDRTCTWRLSDYTLLYSESTCVYQHDKSIW